MNNGFDGICEACGNPGRTFAAVLHAPAGEYDTYLCRPCALDAVLDGATNTLLKIRALRDKDKQEKP